MSFRNSWGSSTVTPGVRAGAVTAVLAVHIGVGAALLYASPEKAQIEEPQTVQVRFVEIAPEVQEAQAPVEAAEPNPEPAAAEPEPVPPPPEPEPEPPPPPPEPEPEPPPPPPEPEPEPPPPEPEPEPPPPPPPEPPPKPKPKPEPKPEPKPKPKPKPKPEPKAEPKPQPRPRPKPPAEPPRTEAPVARSSLPPAGRPQASEQRNVAPAAPKAPASDKPRLIGSVDYVGRRPSPNYPRASQRLREEGRVVIRVTIDVKGSVQRAVVQRSSGFPRLDEEALKAARQARFRPYTENGVPYAAMADVPFDFQLR